MNRIGPLLGVILVLFCASMTAGCSKPQFNLAVASQPNVNPDHSSRPSPVIVKIYELRNDLTFKQAEFTTLFNTPIQVLGADLIAADELVFIPGEARRVAYRPNPNTRFVGIVAGFRQMDRALWRVIKPVDAEEKNWMAIELNDATILVVPDKEAKDWDPEQAVRQYQQQLIKPNPPVAAETAPYPAVAPGSPYPRPGRDSGPYSQYPAQPSVPYTQAPAQAAPGLPPAQPPGAPALEETARAAGTRAEQGAKEAITIIKPDGVGTIPAPPALNVPPTAPAAPSAPTPSLPSMRPF